MTELRNRKLEKKIRKKMMGKRNGRTKKLERKINIMMMGRKPIN